MNQSLSINKPIGYGFVTLNTIGDGNCLLHAICMALYDKYITTDYANKKLLVEKLRYQIAKLLLTESDITQDYACFNLNVEALPELSRHLFFKENGTSFVSDAIDIRTTFFSMPNSYERLVYVIEHLTGLFDKNNVQYNSEDIAEILFKDPRDYAKMLYGNDLKDELIQRKIPITLNYYTLKKVLVYDEEDKLSSLVKKALDPTFYMGDRDFLPYLVEIFNLKIIVLKQGYTKPYIYEPNTNTDVCIILYNHGEIHWELVGKLRTDNTPSCVFMKWNLTNYDQTFVNILKELRMNDVDNLTSRDIELFNKSFSSNIYDDSDYPFSDFSRGQIDVNTRRHVIETLSALKNSFNGNYEDYKKDLEERTKKSAIAAKSYKSTFPSPYYLDKGPFSPDMI